MNITERCFVYFLARHGWKPRINPIKSHQTTIFLWFSHDFPGDGFNHCVAVQDVQQVAATAFAFAAILKNRQVGRGKRGELRKMYEHVGISWWCHVLISFDLLMLISYDFMMFLLGISRWFSYLDITDFDQSDQSPYLEWFTLAFLFHDLNWLLDGSIVQDDEYSGLKGDLSNFLNFLGNFSLVRLCAALASSFWWIWYSNAIN